MPEMTEDHDLLIELKTELKGVRDDIKDLKDGTSARISDHETRLRALERVRWIIAGGAGVAGSLVTFIIEKFAH